MTQYTKFTKNLAYDENFSLNQQNTAAATTMSSTHNHLNAKTPTRGTSNLAAGSPVNPASLPKPVLITNLNSSNIGSLIKNERIKSSALARSVTMRYNTNTKSQFENGNFTNGLIQPANQTNHFHYRKAPAQQQPASAQQHIINEAAAHSKKEYLNLLSSIHRSSSIKLSREKSNLSNYFSSLVNNKERGLNTSTSNLNGVSSHNFSNSASNGLNSSANNYLAKNYIRKQQPFSLRNNNMNTLFHTSNTNISNEGNVFLYNNNASLLANSNTSSFHKGNKNSISLDNVYNGLDSIIMANETHKYNMPMSGTPTHNNNNNSRKLTTNSTSYNNLNSNQLRSSVTPSTTNLIEHDNGLSRLNSKKRTQLRLDAADDELVNEEHQNILVKDLSSSRSNQLKLNEPLNELEAHNYIQVDANDLGDPDNGVYSSGIKKIEIVNKNESGHKKAKPRKINDDAILFNAKLINKLDLIEQLDMNKTLSNRNEGIFTFLLC